MNLLVGHQIFASEFLRNLTKLDCSELFKIVNREPLSLTRSAKALFKLELHLKPIAEI